LRWIDSFISRDETESTDARSAPQEESHLHVPRRFLEETIRTIRDAVQGRPVDVVFNLDEVGISAWGKRKAKKAEDSSSRITQNETPMNGSVDIRR
jgi:chromatin remodeling complex protein RSC6